MKYQASVSLQGYDSNGDPQAKIHIHSFDPDHETPTREVLAPIRVVAEIALRFLLFEHEERAP